MDNILRTLNWFFISLIISLIIGFWISYLIRKLNEKKIKQDEKKIKRNEKFVQILILLRMFAFGIALIAAIGGLISLMLAYHREWWYGGGVDVTSVASTI